MPQAIIRGSITLIDHNNWMPMEKPATKTRHMRASDYSCITKNLGEGLRLKYLGKMC